MNIQISCSLGEIIDKITILDIKCDEIKEDFRVKECKKERDILIDSISYLMDEKLEYYRSILKIINKNIWDDQEVLRNKISINEYYNLAKKVIQDNDARFRVKNIINTICNSSLKEQKSYKIKSCLVACHPGLGDYINMVPAIRYLSTLYDNIILPVREIYLENIKLIYMDFPFIEFKMVSSIPSNYYNDVQNLLNQYQNDELTDIYKMGAFQNNSNIHKSWIPKGFYEDIQIDYDSIYLSKKWFFAINPINKSILEKIKKYSIVITHSETSESVCNEVIKKREIEKNNENTIVIDINKNVYNSEDKEKYEISEYFINKPIIYYMSLLCEANKIIVTNSCLYCLAAQMIHLKAVEKICYVRVRLEENKKIDERFVYYYF